LTAQELETHFPLHVTRREIAFGFHRLPGVDGTVECQRWNVAMQSPS